MRWPSVASLFVRPSSVNATPRTGAVATAASANAPSPRRRRRPSAVSTISATASATKPPREYVSPIVSDERVGRGERAEPRPRVARGVGHHAQRHRQPHRAHERERVPVLQRRAQPGDRLVGGDRAGRDLAGERVERHRGGHEQPARARSARSRAPRPCRARRPATPPARRRAPGWPPATSRRGQPTTASSPRTTRRTRSAGAMPSQPARVVRGPSRRESHAAAAASAATSSPICSRDSSGIRTAPCANAAYAHAKSSARARIAPRRGCVAAGCTAGRC